MSRTLWKWILVISLSLNAGFLATLAWNAAQGGMAMKAANTRPVHLPDYLDLNEEQRRRWQQDEQVFLKDLSSNWREIRARREVLIQQIFSSRPDRTAIDREQRRIADLQDAQQRRVIAQLLAERELLDERQRAALMKLLLDRYTQETTEEERLHR
jgi:Spy/CpxP family protein refolding chaperone